MQKSEILGLAALGGIGAVMLLNKKSAAGQSYSYYYPGYYDLSNSTEYAGATNYPSGNVAHIPITPSPYIRPAHPPVAGALQHAVNNQNSNDIQYSVDPQTGRVQASYAAPIGMQASAYSGSYIPFRQSSGSRITQNTGNRPINTGINDFVPQHYLPQRPAHDPINYVYVTPVNANLDPALAPVEVTPINPNFAPIDYVSVTPQNPNVPTDPLAYVNVTPQNPAVDTSSSDISYVSVTPQYYQPIQYVQVTPVYQPPPIDYVSVTPQVSLPNVYTYVYSPPPQTYYSPVSTQNYYWTQPYYSQQNYYFASNAPNWGSYYGGEGYFSGSANWG